jgi:hypothetical protein
MVSIVSALTWRSVGTHMLNYSATDVAPTQEDQPPPLVALY